jgi:hypothetical protein
MSRAPHDRSDPRSGRRASPPAGVFPTEEEVARHAFDLFITSGRTLSRRDCWRRAEAHLLDRAARRVTHLRFTL